MNTSLQQQSSSSTEPWPQRLVLSSTFGKIESAPEILSRVSIGSKIEVYWIKENRYYTGVVTEHHPDIYPQQEHAYTIHYDDGDVEVIDLARERFHILDKETDDRATSSPSIAAPKLLGDEDRKLLITPSPRGNRKPKAKCDLPQAFLDYEIYWGGGPGEGWRPFSMDREKIKIYDCSFLSLECEVEWGNQGLVYKTYLRKTQPQKKRKAAVVNQAPQRPDPPAAAKAKSKKAPVKKSKKLPIRESLTLSLVSSE